MNEIKLENWWENYKIYPKLSISEVKTLYLQYQQTNDKKIFEEIINGTMYLIYNSLKNYYYVNYNATDFDIEDIIMNSIELWIKYLKSGKILNLQLFSEYFRRNFHYQLISMTLKASFINVSTMNLYGIGYRKMASLFFMYVHGLNNSIPLRLQNEFRQLSITAEEMGIDLKLVSSRKFEFIIKPIIYCTIKEKLNDKEEANDEYEQIINEMFYKQIEQMAGKELNKAKILKAYCGFYNDKPMSVNDLASEYNCTRQNIEQIINRELKKIRKQIK